MADHTKYDPRVESLVVETETKWGSDLHELTAEEKSVIAKAIHARPELASEIAYDRTHTGFIRTITVHETDIARLYQSEVN
ncbi:MAG: hypothetical protein KDA80_09315 [Planctomycetaceae bacterium]|nr:hypothetical protein [Planctomycetaceae bacterium]